MPRHSGHRLLAKKKARPQQGQRDGPRRNRRTGESPAAALKERMPLPRGRLLFSADFVAIVYPERKAIQSLLQQALMGHAHGHLPLKRFPVFVTHHFGNKGRSVRLDGLAKQENLALELFSVCHFVASPAKEWHSSWLRTLNFLA